MPQSAIQIILVIPLANLKTTDVTKVEGFNLILLLNLSWINKIRATRSLSSCYFYIFLNFCKCQWILSSSLF